MSRASDSPRPQSTRNFACRNYGLFRPSELPSFRARNPGFIFDVPELVVDPVVGAPRRDDLPHVRHPPGPLALGRGQGGMDGVRLLLDVEGVHRDGAVAELLV